MKEEIISNIENNFRNEVKNNKKVKNAHLLVHSNKLGVHLNFAEGSMACLGQPNHLASVGKLFTSTIVGILQEEGMLNFDDKIINYLDEDIASKIHIYKGKDYSSEIKIKHLLNQTSGLNDVFYHLLKKIVDNPKMEITTREAILWGKENLKTKNRPGEKHFYTDTNYYLLGLIIERVTKKHFYEVMHELIFEPLKMNHAYMSGFSAPKINSEYPTAKLYLEDIDFLNFKNASQIDYAGGSVVATLEEYLVFMRALVSCEIVKEETLSRMLSDDSPMRFPSIGINYGYGIWKFKTIPLIMPEKYNCWGCVGVTGAYMFYHSKTESYIIGTFNDTSYRSKGLRFMFLRVIRELLKIK